MVYYGNMLCSSNWSIGAIMNEKLTEIAINAKVEHCISHVRLQEFAELIIRECANIADTCEPYRSSDVILRYFGVDNGNV